MSVDEKVKAKGLELVEKVNRTLKADNFGTEQLADVVESFYDVCEVIEEKIEGKDVGISDLISGVGPGLFASFEGINQVGAEAMNLRDEEIIIAPGNLVDRGGIRKFGNNAQKYMQLCKMLLFGIQTYSVFKG